MAEARAISFPLIGGLGRNEPPPLNTASQVGRLNSSFVSFHVLAKRFALSEVLTRACRFPTIFNHFVPSASHFFMHKPYHGVFLNLISRFIEPMIRIFHLEN